MGCWGAGALENDDALDWIGGFMEIPSVEELITALSDGQPECDSGAACAALAAAEVVAALSGRPSGDFLELGYHEPLSNAHLELTESLRRLAADAVANVSSDSELKDLWDKSDADGWDEAIEELVSHLKR